MHPHLYDRLIAAGVPPEYPRPDPPSRMRLWGGVVAAAALLVPVATLLSGVPVMFEVWAAYSERASNLELAFRLDAGSLMRRAMLEDANEEGERALTFAFAAAALDPARHEPLALAAMVLAHEGRCEEGRELLDRAEALSQIPEAPWIFSAGESLDACEPRPALARSPV